MPMNKMHPHLLQSVQKRIAKLTNSIESDSKELYLLQKALNGEFPDCYVVNTHDNSDYPMVLFVGDVVRTKYGDNYTIERFDYEEEMIHFEGGDSLSDHRMSHVIRRKGEADELGDSRD